MARKRFQKGHVRLRETKGPYWEGFYREDIRLPDGRIERKQRSVHLGRLSEIPTKKLAERKLAEKLKEVNEVDYLPRVVMTLREFIEKTYRPTILEPRKRSMKRSYNQILDRHVIPGWGDRMLDAISREDLQGFINLKAKSKLSWNTVKNIRIVLSAVFQAALEYEYCRSNPARRTRLPPEPPHVQPKLPSDEELLRLEEALDQPSRTAVWLARTTGLRVGELLALRWHSVDWRHKCVWVREAIYEGELQSPKTHRSTRPVYLSDEQIARIVEFKSTCRPGASSDDWVFPNRQGTGPISARNLLRRVIQPAAKELGITHVTWHLLRHWNATMMMEENVPIKVAQERLGHARIETTMKYYVHATQDSHEQAAQAISRRVQASEMGEAQPGFVSGVVSKWEATCA